MVDSGDEDSDQEHESQMKTNHFQFYPHVMKITGSESDSDNHNAWHLMCETLRSYSLKGQQICI